MVTMPAPRADDGQGRPAAAVRLLRRAGSKRQRDARGEPAKGWLPGQLGFQRRQMGNFVTGSRASQDPDGSTDAVMGNFVTDGFFDPERGQDNKIRHQPVTKLAIHPTAEV